jgi:hypothetical protein
MSERVGPDAPHVKMYLRDILDLNRVPLGLFPVLYSIFPRMSDLGEIHIGKGLRNIIAKECNLELSTVNRYITMLYQYHLLLKFDDIRAEYVVNPMYFSKAKSLDAAMMRMKCANIDWRVPCE